MRVENGLKKLHSNDIATSNPQDKKDLPNKNQDCKLGNPPHGRKTEDPSLVGRNSR